MPETKNPIIELRDILKEIDTFLDSDTVSKIKDLIKAIIDLLDGIVNVDLTALFDQLIDLLKEIQRKVDELDFSQITEIKQVTDFMGKITRLLDAIKALFEETASTIDGITPNLNFLGSLEELERLKDDIVELIGKIIVHLEDLKSTGN